MRLANASGDFYNDDFTSKQKNKFSSFTDVIPKRKDAPCYLRSDKKTDKPLIFEKRKRKTITSNLVN